MTVVETLLCAFVAAAVARGTRINAEMLRTRRPPRPRRGDPPPPAGTVVIAVYREERIAAATVEHFRERFPGWRVVYVTTAKERPAATRAVLERMGARVLHCPRDRGDKATQLNHAIDALLAEGSPGPFAFYDADSRPEPPEAPPPPGGVAQQATLYLSNLGSLGALMRGSALYQTRWSLGFERRMWRSRRLRYCVGHGLVVDAAVLRAQRFAEGSLSEDIPFGTEASLRGVPFRVLATLDRSEHVRSLRGFAMQNGRWFAGCMRDAAGTLARRPRPEVAARAAELLLWPLAPVAWLAGLAYAVAAPSAVAALLLGAHLLLDAVPGYLATVWTLRRMGEPVPLRLADLAGFAARPLINLPGPVVYALGLHRSPETRRDLHFVKTER